MSFQPTLDAILLIVLIGFTAWGFMNGLIRTVGGIIGIVVAAALSSRYYLWLASLVSPLFGRFEALAPIVSFALLFLLAGRLFGFLVLLFEKAFDVVAFIPFLKSTNRLLGAVFGLLLGLLVVGTILFVAGRYSPWLVFNEAVAHSPLAQLALTVSRVLVPLFPLALRQLQSYF
jgi:uncharacterized membrane protein required for colicin V production